MWGKMWLVRRLSGRVSDEAYGGWRKFCDLHGVSFTAVLEAFGRTIAEGRTPMEAEVVDLARKIDRERSERS